MEEVTTTPLTPEAHFGKATRGAHELVHYIPSRLAAIFWLAAGLFLPENNVRAVAGKMLMDIVKQPSQLLALISASTVRRGCANRPRSFTPSAPMGRRPQQSALATSPWPLVPGP